LAKLLNLNLGCGANRIPGFIGVDRFGSPDVKHNLEEFPWPWDDNSVESIMMSHILEHLGQTTEIYFGIIKELYRICVDNAEILIKVPHPRHIDFLGDPTHVRAIIPEGLVMLSKKFNHESIKRNGSNSTLGLFLDVDFEIIQCHRIYDPEWKKAIDEEKITPEELQQATKRYNNVIKEYSIILKVIKPENDS
jgi:hypothetical protein